MGKQIYRFFVFIYFFLLDDTDNANVSLIISKLIQQQQIKRNGSRTYPVISAHEKKQSQIKKAATTNKKWRIEGVCTKSRRRREEQEEHNCAVLSARVEEDYLNQSGNTKIATFWRKQVSIK